MKRLLSLILLLCFRNLSLSQTPDPYENYDSLSHRKYYHSLDSAILNPRAVYRLSLNSRNLRRIPKVIKELKNIVQIDLGNNDLKRLPRWIRRLDSLKIIWLGGNKQ